MIFKIKNKRKIINNFLFALIWICLILWILFYPQNLLAALLSLTFSIVLYCIDTTICTEIIIEDDYLVIKNYFLKTYIEFSEINDIQIEPYKTGGKGHIEERIRMIIHVNTGSAFSVNDSVIMKKTIFGAEITPGNGYSIEDVPLFKAYQIIKSKL